MAIYGGIGLYLCNRPACRASNAASSHRLLEIGIHFQIISSFFAEGTRDYAAKFTSLMKTRD